MLRFIKKEFFILSIFSRLLTRDFKKYFKVASICYFIGVFRISRPAKPAYFFCRYLDDLADGDLKVPKEYSSFEQLTHHMQRIINGHPPGHKKLEILLTDVLQKFERGRQRDEMVRNTLDKFLRSMSFDYQRRKNKPLLTSKELLDNYHFSFSSVIQLAVIGLGITMPSSSIKNLGELQGRFYALQDLQSDIKKGIINIPQEIADKIDLTDDLEKCLSNDIFKHWVQQEIQSCKELIHSLQTSVEEGRPKRMIDILVNPIMADIQKKKYVQL